MTPTTGPGTYRAVPRGRELRDLLVEHLEVACESDLARARARAQALADRLGLCTSDRLILQAAVSELSRNIVQHAGGGEILLGVHSHAATDSVVIVARDRGPGIDDLTRAEGRGLGLSGVRRLMDQVSIHSAPGRGTIVTATKTVRGTARTRDRAA
jgi:serine/threonine-protein kinase RsbT